MLKQANTPSAIIVSLLFLPLDALCPLEVEGPAVDGLAGGGEGAALVDEAPGALGAKDDG